MSQPINILGLTMDEVKVLDAALDMCQSRISETTDLIDRFDEHLIPMWDHVQVLRKIVNSILSGEAFGFQETEQ